MPRLEASRNLRARDRQRDMFPGGLALAPAPEGVSPYTHRLDWPTRSWVRRDDPPPPTYQESRRGNYPAARSQLAVLTDFMFAVARGEPLPMEAIDTLSAQIAAVKAAHPKPKTPA